MAGEAGAEELFWLRVAGPCSVPHADAMKRSACIEGAQMALSAIGMESSEQNPAESPLHR